MNIETQLRIKNNPNNTKFLRENSYWYKYLNRSKYYIKDFENAMKEKYKLTTKDKMEKMVDSLDTISKVLDILS